MVEFEQTLRLYRRNPLYRLQSAMGCRDLSASCLTPETRGSP